VSLIGALTHLGKVPQHRKLWAQSVVGYTVGGLVSAATVGVLLAALGRWLMGPVPGDGRFFMIAVFSLLLAGRELGWVAFPLPERRRQSERMWLRQFGFRDAAIMWGVHIGIGFSTQINYGGFWAIVIVIAAVGNAGFGAVLLGSYWVGRALPVWLSPWILPALPVPSLRNLQSQQPLYRWMNAVGLAWSAGITLFMMPCGGMTKMVWITSKVCELGWLNISYILLWGLALLPALLLHKVLRDVVWLSREVTRRSPFSGLAGSQIDRVPQFSAPLLGTQEAVTSSDLNSQEAVLMFVRPEDGARQLKKQLRTSVPALWSKAKGRLYVMCSGSNEGCCELLPELQFNGDKTIRIPVLLDEDDAIARLFRVKSTPVVFGMDAEGRIVGFGKQISATPELEREGM